MVRLVHRRGGGAPRSDTLSPEARQDKTLAIHSSGREDLILNRLVVAGALVALVTLSAMNVAAVNAQPIFSPPRSLPNSSGFGEPSIASAPDGTLYVTAPGSASALWRSVDGGANWLRVANSLGSSGDSDVAIDANGVLYVSDLFSNVPVSVSFDQGATMAYETATATGGSIDRQWTAAVGDGTVYSVWRDGSTERVAVSHDQGVSYTRHVVSTGVGLQGNVVAKDEMTAYIPFGGTGGMWLARTTDGGVTWQKTNVYPSSSTTLFPAVDFDDAGDLYMTWVEGSNEDFSYNVRLARLTNGGTTVASVATIYSGHTSIFPWIAAGAPGHVAVAWLDTAGVLGALPIDPNAAATAEWTIKLAYSQDANLGHAAAWAVQDATPLVHTGPICTMGTACFPIANPIYGNRMLLDFFEIAERPDGGIVIAYSADNALVNTGSTVLKVVRQTGGPGLQG